MEVISQSGIRYKAFEVEENKCDILVIPSAETRRKKHKVAFYPKLERAREVFRLLYIAQKEGQAEFVMPEK
jgi:hypothetical protein